MLKHVAKLIWNRKGASFLLIVEVFISFLVVVAVVGLASHSYDLYNQPTGFVGDDVWRISCSAGSETGDQDQWEATLQRMVSEIDALSEVVGTGRALIAPYSGTFMGADVGEELGWSIIAEYVAVSVSYREAMRLELVAGRWFETADEALAWTPAVISRELAEAAFGDDDPLGQALPFEDDESNEYRVIGVSETFRHLGELRPATEVLFVPIWSQQAMLSRYLLVRVAPGTPASFQQSITDTLTATAPGWTFKMRTLSELREEHLLERLAPVLVVALIAGFLMLMVALGLFGVLWQNVTQRTREIGLRRAQGATAADVYHQILGELLMVATFGIVPAVLLVGQLPLIGVLPTSPGVFAMTLGISTAILYVLVALCGLYPSWLATRVEPAVALHYE